jgi:hypothetical protein
MGIECVLSLLCAGIVIKFGSRLTRRFANGHLMASHAGNAVPTERCKSGNINTLSEA